MKINFIIQSNLNSKNNYKFKKQNPAMVNFQGFYCKEEDFEVKKLYDIPCPICGIEMINQRQMQAFIKESKNAKGQALVRLIEKYEKYFREKEKRIAQIIKYEASIDSEKDISQIIEEQYKKSIIKIKKEQTKALKELEQFLKNQKNANFKQSEKIIKKHKETLEKDENSFIDKKELMKDLTIFFESDKINKPTLRKILSKFPDTNIYFNFFNSFHNATNKKLAFILSNTGLATCEHVKPKSQNGENSTANYLAQCCKCNSTRNSQDFFHWVNANKDFEINFQKYSAEVSRNILQKELPNEYETYLDDITQTINLETNGKINLKAPQAETPEEKQKEKEIDISFFEKKLKKKQEKLKALENLFETLKTDKEFYFIVELDKALKEKERILETLKKERGIQETEKERIKKHKRKEAAFLDLVSKLENTKDLKTRKKLKSKISKLETFLSERSYKTFEEELHEREKRIQNAEKNLENIDNRIISLKSNINFSQNTKEKFKAINIEEKINSLSKEIKKYENILERFRQNKLNLYEAATLLNQI